MARAGIFILFGAVCSTLAIYVLEIEGVFRYWGWNEFQIIVLWFLIFILGLVLMAFDMLLDRRRD